MPPTRRSRRSTFIVLSDPSLFRAVTQFTAGISFAVHQVKVQLACAREWNNHVAPQDVALWQSAVCAGDRRTLEALQTLSATAALGARVRKVLGGILAYALMHSKDWELLAWLDNPDAFPDENHADLGWTANRLLGEHGDVDVVRWLKNRGFAFSSDLVIGAVSKGHLPLVEFLHRDTGYAFVNDKTKMVDLAATHGHLDVVTFLLANRPGEVASDTLMNGAAANGHLHIIQFLHERDIGGCSAGGMNGAATNGHIHVVQFLHEHALGGGCSTVAVDGAAKNGHAEVVAFLLEHRREGFSRDAVLSAVRANRRDILELLCAFDRVTTVRAGLPLAAELGNVALVASLCGAGGGDLAACQVPREDLVNRAASAGRLELIELFHAHAHFRFGVRTMHNAAVNNHLDVVKFLHEHRREGCKVDTLFECDARGHTVVLAYLCSHRPMAKPQAAIARAKKEHRTLLAAQLQLHSLTRAPKTTYEYRRL